MQKSRMHQRTNDEWVEALSDPVSEDAVSDLNDLLFRGLRAPLSGIFSKDLDSITNDFVQQTLAIILEEIHTFHGECNFLTWALKNTIHFTFNELRRQRWEESPIGLRLENSPGVVSSPNSLTDSINSIELEEFQSNLLIKLDEMLENELTNQQYAAILAFFQWGMPVHAGAHQLGVSCNRFIKLLHSARKRLKGSLQASIETSAIEYMNQFDWLALIPHDAQKTYAWETFESEESR